MDPCRERMRPASRELAAHDAPHVLPCADGGGAAKAGARGAVRGGGISQQEARSILDVKSTASQTQVEEAFSRLHSMNSAAKGGSIYLQSKIANARSALSDAPPPAEDAPGAAGEKAGTK
jgi:hypothetical protein